MSKTLKYPCCHCELDFPFDDRIDNCSLRPTGFISIIQFKNEAVHQGKRKENAVREH
jgi:hypothetical protein